MRWAPDHVPSYRLHKKSGQAIVTLDGRDFLLGEFGSPGSRAKYNQLIARWIAGGRRLPDPAPPAVTVAQVVARFWEHAQAYYRDREGNPSAEISPLKLALRPLIALHAETPAAAFDSVALEGVRNEMIRLGWVRTSINRHISRIRGVFNWAARNKLVTSATAYDLSLLKGLKIGRSAAAESDEIHPVGRDVIAATLPFCPPPVAAMINLQLSSAARPGEVCQMRGRNLDRRLDVWVFWPEQHKNLHRGQQRFVTLGARAQAAIRAFLREDADEFMFKPFEAILAMRARRAAARKTPLSYGNSAGTNRVKSPKRSVGERYTVASYRRAIRRAAERANEWAKGGKIVGNDERLIPCWHPHQLRHDAATEIAVTHGLDGARVILGHKHADTTTIYAARSLQQAIEISRAVG